MSSGNLSQLFLKKKKRPNNLRFKFQNDPLAISVMEKTKAIWSTTSPSFSSRKVLTDLMDVQQSNLEAKTNEDTGV